MSPANGLRVYINAGNPVLVTQSLLLIHLRIFVHARVVQEEVGPLLIPSSNHSVKGQNFFLASYESVKVGSKCLTVPELLCVAPVEEVLGCLCTLSAVFQQSGIQVVAGHAMTATHDMCMPGRGGNYIHASYSVTTVSTQPDVVDKAVPDADPAWGSMR